MKKVALAKRNLCGQEVICPPSTPRTARMRREKNSTPPFPTIGELMLNSELRPERGVPCHDPIPPVWNQGTGAGGLRPGRWDRPSAGGEPSSIFRLAAVALSLSVLCSMNMQIISA